ncbi:hypothetical protein N7509_000185 [Penicillium cosmopolitanum]|uniref:Mitochondrial resolvase Ydc2 catalytic domain-containing protein n=1 Tax=Penicillium cosmopolitanum TaxID=1131564 RepID=A0A9W9WCF7_9EURO|nr:uncharacterized protein N7509_000185 [Penicillium cosmopolitanum]KAJ5414851.1 hypothetical protein N7509_000185 [Penicillium cosmopolitanum]
MVCLLRWALCGGFVISLVDAIFAARPQAIGIDIGPDMITVAHASSSDNVTLPACIIPELGDPFSSYLLRLRLESWSDDTHALYGRKNEGTSGISNAVAKLFARLVSPLTYCSHDTANLSWVRQCVCSAWHDITARLRSSKRSELVNFTLNYVKDAFVDILTRLQEEARTKHNIDMQSAVIALPDFFNQTLVDLFLEASRKVGITSLVEPMSRTASQCESPAMARNGHFPMDPWGSAGLDRDITRSAIERSKILQTWLSFGGSKAALQGEVRKARVLIRDNIDREVLASAGGAEDHQDHHHNEYPLHLKDPDTTAVLSWVDVEAAEMKYIQSIARTVHNYLIAANNPTGDIRDDMIATKIDKAFILTSGFDESLIKQSLESVLSDVEIIGGRLRDCYLAAEGAAQVGLLYQQAWDQRQRLLLEKDEL